MLARYKVELIRRLLAVQTISRRRVAKTACVSREAVDTIAERKAFLPSGVPDAEPLEPLVPPCRCATCGDWVFPPCHACATRALGGKRKSKTARPRPRRRAIIVGLDLEPRHFQRYLQVRRYRRAMEGDEE
jgi:hypothetical protein